MARLPAEGGTHLDDVLTHFGECWAVLLLIGIYVVFLAFIPFYQKSQWKPTGAFMAFVVAFAFEMFGIPLSMYAITWALGHSLPDGILWGHTLYAYIGVWGADLDLIILPVALAIVILGWHAIHKNHWSKEEGRGQLVTSGIYRYIRHPQYTGFLLASFGILIDWATLPLLIMFPILVVLYYRQAKREEKDMEKKFGQAYLDYKARTSMFIPLPKRHRVPRGTPSS